MRLYSSELERTLHARSEALRDERPLARRWRTAVDAVVGAVDRAPWRRLQPGVRDDALLARALLAVPARGPFPPRLPKVVHVIGSLASGGAERQAVYVARESRARALAETRMLVLNPLEGAARHYLPLAESGGVEVHCAGARADRSVARRMTTDPRLLRLLGAIDRDIRPWCADLAGEFEAVRPDLVHAWLDHANVWSGIAALATGVPRIVLSTRNVNPTHFPSLHGPYFRDWYRVLAESPRVRFIANSEAGAADYAAWIGIDRSRFRVVLNGFDAAAMRVADAGGLERLRAELGIDGRRVVLGVFRLSEEKQPLEWIECVRRILEAEPEAVAVHAGDGAMRGEFERAAATLPADRFRMLGIREDIGSLQSIATVVLHASRKEGTPNALLEAQAAGCPVVATAGGGTVDAVRDGVTGSLHAVGDIDGLVNGVLAILRDDTLRGRLSAAARDFVHERFGLARMVDETLAACGIGDAA